MARPGLEPGTPRFSVGRSEPSGWPKSLETMRFWPKHRYRQMSAICGLFPPLVGMAGASGPTSTLAQSAPGVSGAWPLQSAHSETVAVAGPTHPKATKEECPRPERYVGPGPCGVRVRTARHYAAALASTSAEPRPWVKQLVSFSMVGSPVLRLVVEVVVAGAVDPVELLGPGRALERVDAHP
jgi:hypothetical protein